MKRLLLFAALALSAACTHPAGLNAPPTFARLEGASPFTYRAASANGVVLGVRTEKNELHANVDFWTDAIDLRLRRQGYVADAARAVTSATGMPGKQVRYSREEDRRTVRYWVTVYVTDTNVYVVEAAGDKDAFDPQEKSIEGIVTSLKT